MVTALVVAAALMQGPNVTGMQAVGIVRSLLRACGAKERGSLEGLQRSGQSLARGASWDVELKCDGLVYRAAITASGDISYVEADWNATPLPHESGPFDQIAVYKHGMSMVRAIGERRPLGTADGYIDADGRAMVWIPVLINGHPFFDHDHHYRAWFMAGSRKLIGINTPRPFPLVNASVPKLSADEALRAATGPLQAVRDHSTVGEMSLPTRDANRPLALGYLVVDSSIARLAWEVPYRAVQDRGLSRLLVIASLYIDAVTGKPLQPLKSR